MITPLNIIEITTLDDFTYAELLIQQSRIMLGVPLQYFND